ncbi:MAG: hypothetical protein ACE5JL_11050 [Dehalococcoidia bacterium]
MAVSGTEWELLKAIADLGGSTSVKRSGAKAGLQSEYARILCESMGRYDYVDVFRSGKVDITRKGWQELRRRAWQPPDDEDDDEEGKRRQPEGELAPMEELRRLFDMEKITPREYQARRLEIRRTEEGWAKRGAAQEGPR